MYLFHPISRPVSLTGIYTAFEAHRAPDFVFRGEVHDFYEIALFLSGTVNVTAGATSFLLEAPAAVLHAPMEFHSFRSAENTELDMIVFSFSADRMPPFEKHIFQLSEENIDHAKRALSLLQKANFSSMDDLKDGGTASCALLELELLLLTLSEDGTMPYKERSVSAHNFRRALRVIEENLEQPLDTAMLAQMMHVSPSLLKKTFARHAGVGVMEYVRTRKINAAIDMLREGESVQEIALRLGFTNAGYFSTAFRRVTGHTPSYYKNR